MNVCFLLGSGISQPANLPSVEKITEEVLSTTKFFRSPERIYRRVSLSDHSPELVHMQMPEMERIGQLLRWLKGHAETRYAAVTPRQVNYEDLAYLAAQIRDDALDEYENPAIGPLVCCAVNTFPELRPAGKVGERAGEVVDFIADVVADMLSSPPSQTNHLNLFREAASDFRFGTVNLFTLNHDLLLERYLRDNGVAVVDGFAQKNNLGIRKWNPTLFDCCSTHRPTPTVRLYKLHGSVDWWRFRPREAQSEEQTANPWNEEYIGIRSNSALVHARDAQGREHEKVDARALLLAGTFNKMFSYLNHVFLELHYRFHRTLGQTTRLVVSGYGFSDKGINHRITDWMCSTCSTNAKKMILIDPRSLADLQRTARGAIAGKLMSWEENGSLVHLKVGIGDANANWKAILTELATGYNQEPRR